MLADVCFAPSCSCTYLIVTRLLPSPAANIRRSSIRSAPGVPKKLMDKIEASAASELAEEGAESVVFPIL